MLFILNKVVGDLFLIVFFVMFANKLVKMRRTIVGC